MAAALLKATKVTARMIVVRFMTKVLRVGSIVEERIDYCYLVGVRALYLKFDQAIHARDKTCIYIFAGSIPSTRRELKNEILPR